jgi:hypothetical protein
VLALALALVLVLVPVLVLVLALALVPALARLDLGVNQGPFMANSNCEERLTCRFRPLRRPLGGSRRCKTLSYS